MWWDGFIWGVGVSYVMWIAFVWAVWRWRAPK
jgi:hypothetical protein